VVLVVVCHRARIVCKHSNSLMFINCAFVSVLSPCDNIQM
jgi:hypothetical protein